MSATARIALIHALAQSHAPVEAEFERSWPDAVRMHVLDDSLSGDVARGADATGPRMMARFATLADYAISTGAEGILFTCSAFGPCIDAVKQRWPAVPILKPGEAMIEEAARLGTRIALVASFAPTLATMPAEFPGSVTVVPFLATGALDALADGDGDAHDAIVAAAAEEAYASGCSVIALAQFSIARAAAAVQARVDVPVLTTVSSAVTALRARIAARTAA
jgi:Asp/Glu/hydantoin racemase